MSDADRVAAFMRLAEEELAARLLSHASPRQAAYFLQQAAEKAVRALLTRSGIPFGTSHNLGQMAAALPAEHPLREAVNLLDSYSVAATKYRYPTPSGRLPDPPSMQALDSAVKEIGAFISQVRAHLDR